MVVFGVVLGVAERVGRQKVDLERVSVGQGVAMGFAQALALIPGVSRSGGTISAGLFLGLTRPAAVRLSFLLAIPAVVASGLFELRDVTMTAGGPTALQMAVATLIAFVVVTLFPFYWMLWTAFKSDRYLYNVDNVPFKFGQGSPTTKNFGFLFHHTAYPTWLKNSVIV